MDYQIYHFPNIDSTNTWALQNNHLCPREKITFVRADRQSEGKGRFKHRWHSLCKDNLYTSFCVFIPEEKGVQLPLAQVMALCIVESIEEIFGLSLKIKWPNDLLLLGKKIGGILTETKNVEKAIFHVIGVGINVAMPFHLLQEIGQPATSLSMEKEIKNEDLENLAETLKKHFALTYPQYMKDGFAPFLSKIQTKYAHIPNQPLSFHEREGTPIKGLFHSLNEDGSLNLQLPTGILKRCISGVLSTEP